jgi:ribonuclease E
MTRQRLRESSVKWNMTLSLDSFALKIVKKAEEFAFSNKAKIINLSIPEKVKIFIEKNLVKEINHFRKKYKFEFNLISDKNLILPEYKIDLLNKNKKIIKKIENLEKIERIDKKFIEKDFIRKEFVNKKFIKKDKFKKKYNYKSKERKYSFDNKKLARY